jgi:hypothetical protein
VQLFLLKNVWDCQACRKWERPTKKKRKRSGGLVVVVGDISGTRRPKPSQFKTLARSSLSFSLAPYTTHHVAFSSCSQSTSILEGIFIVWWDPPSLLHMLPSMRMVQLFSTAVKVRHPDQRECRYHSSLIKRHDTLDSRGIFGSPHLL